MEALVGTLNKELALLGLPPGTVKFREITLTGLLFVCHPMKCVAILSVLRAAACQHQSSAAQNKNIPHLTSDNIAAGDREDGRNIFNYVNSCSHLASRNSSGCLIFVGLFSLKIQKKVYYEITFKNI